jgi:hypothetical protein
MRTSLGVGIAAAGPSRPADGELNLNLESGDKLTYTGNRANLAGFEAQV